MGATQSRGVRKIIKVLYVYTYIMHKAQSIQEVQQQSYSVDSVHDESLRWKTRFCNELWGFDRVQDIPNYDPAGEIYLLQYEQLAAQPCS